MKNLLAIALGVVFTTSVVCAAEQQISVPQDIQPMLRFGVFDTSNTVAQEVEKYSLGNPSHKLCWVAFNMPFQPLNQVKEIFNAPQKTTFIDGPSKITTSEDGKTHTLEVSLPSNNGEFIERCWSFGENDPIGKYSVDVQVNDVTYPTQYFEVVK
ncbi:hypothetical protein [Otariodibacter oris]|uniref:Uncharacterized protein n=1 Tax=Otariodibacter oris TaxID=1032623 RepID=A0A420XGE8_9PAST|nr:hypothetical protein [Otariodibacter oris]QGM80370.1 hypothetical protein A6A10_02630 [Otariodibacter oris]RKR71741.1 hypothetical protein DES31_1477 [Otariodibacter oris]